MYVLLKVDSKLKPHKRGNKGEVELRAQLRTLPLYLELYLNHTQPSPQGKGSAKGDSHSQSPASMSHGSLVPSS